MSIYEIMENTNIQGAYCIKYWNDDKEDYIIIREGTDFDVEARNISAYILDKHIKYLYATNGVITFELDLSENEIGVLNRTLSKTCRA